MRVIILILGIISFAYSKIFGMIGSPTTTKKPSTSTIGTTTTTTIKTASINTNTDYMSGQQSLDVAQSAQNVAIIGVTDPSQLASVSKPQRVPALIIQSYKNAITSFAKAGQTLTTAQKSLFFDAQVSSKLIEAIKALINTFANNINGYAHYIYLLNHPVIITVPTAQIGTTTITKPTTGGISTAPSRTSGGATIGTTSDNEAVIPQSQAPVDRQAIIDEMVSTADYYQSELDTIPSLVKNASAQDILHWDTLKNSFLATIKGLIIKVTSDELKDISTATTFTDTEYANAKSLFNTASAAWKSIIDAGVDKNSISIPGYEGQMPMAFQLFFGQIAHQMYLNAINQMAAQAKVATINDVASAQSPNRQLLTKAIGYLTDAHSAIDNNPDLADIKWPSVTDLSAASKFLDAASAATDFAAQMSNLASAAHSLATAAPWYSKYLTAWQNIFMARNSVSAAQAQLVVLQKTYSFSTITDTIACNTTPCFATDINKTTQQLLTALITAFGPSTTTTFSVYDNYANAATAYAQALTAASQSRQPFLTSDQAALEQQNIQNVQTITTLLQKSADTFDNLNSLITSITTASSGADAATIQSNASVVIQLAQAADLASATNTAADALWPFGQLAPLETFVTQYIAYALTYQASIATSIQNNLYAAAYDYVKTKLLSSSAAQLITNNFNAIGSHFIDLAHSALESAQQADDSTRANKQTSLASNIMGVWDSAITAAVNAYIWGTTSGDAAALTSGRQAYVDSLNAYLASYMLANVEDEETRKAVLIYRWYLLKNNDTAVTGDLVVTEDGNTTTINKDAVVSTLQTLLTTFVVDGNKYATAVTSSPTTQKEFANKLDGISSILAWQRDADALVAASDLALANQQAATQTMAVSTKLFIKTNATYSSPLIIALPKVTVSATQQTLATTYQDFGDWATSQLSDTGIQTPSAKETCTAMPGYNVIAANAYNNAANLFSTIGNTTQSAMLMSQASGATALSIADQKSMAVRGSPADVSNDKWWKNYSIYNRYILDNYIMPIPANTGIVAANVVDMMNQYNQQLAAQQDVSVLKNQIEESLRSIAAMVILYNSLEANGLYDYFVEAGYHLADVIASQQAHGGITNADDIQAYGSYVDDAQEYKQQLAVWMNNGLSIGDQTIKTLLTYFQSPNGSASLLFCNLPVLAAAIDKADQSAAATQLMQSLVEYSTAPLGSTTQQNYQKSRIASLPTRVQSANLSATYQLLQKAEYMSNLKDLDDASLTLLVADKSEKTHLTNTRTTIKNATVTSLDADNAKPLRDAIADASAYFDVTATYGQTAIDGYSLSIPGSEITIPPLSAQASGIIGHIHERKADFLTNMLIGNPNACEYQTILQKLGALPCQTDSSCMPGEFILAAGAYKTAGLDDAAHNVATKLGQVMEKVAQAYLATDNTYNNLLQAAQYYQAAAAIYQDIVKDGGNTQAQAQAASLNAIQYFFKAAAQAFATWYGVYNATTQKPVTLPNGTPVTSFAAFVNTYGDVQYSDPDFVNDYIYIQNSILNALLVYNSLTTLIAQAQNPSANVEQSSLDSSSLQSATAAKTTDSTVSSYLNGTFSSFISAHASTLAKSLADDFFTAMGGVTITNLSHLTAWINTIFSYLITTYNNAYYAGGSIEDQANNLSSDLNAQASNLQSPVGQYFESDDSQSAC